MQFHRVMGLSVPHPHTAATDSTDHRGKPVTMTVAPYLQEVAGVLFVFSLGERK